MKIVEKEAKKTVVDSERLVNGVKEWAEKFTSGMHFNNNNEIGGERAKRASLNFEEDERLYHFLTHSFARRRRGEIRADRKPRRQFNIDLQQTPASPSPRGRNGNRGQPVKILREEAEDAGEQFNSAKQCARSEGRETKERDCGIFG